MKRQKLSTSCAPSNNVLFEDLFYITSLDNSKFEKVGRIRGRSSGFDANIVLDVNINIYPLEPKQNLTICITTSVALPSTAKEELTAYDLSDTTPQRLNTLMDEYDYVMYGRIFRLVENPSDRRTIYASFGGLLMSLTADKHVVGEMELGTRVYILLRKK